MANGVKSCDDSLVGRKVKVLWPKQKSFYEGVVSSQSHSGRNLVVCTDGVEEMLNPKKDNGESVNDDFDDQGTQKCNPGRASSYVHPESDASKAYCEELVGCKLKILHLKTKTFSEGVVGSYDHSHKKHWVVYNDGIQELMNLTNHIAPVEDVSADQVKKEDSSASDYSSSMCGDDDMDARVQVGKKHKRQSSNPMSRPTSPILSKDKKIPKVEAGTVPLYSKSSSNHDDNSLHNVKGYEVKASVGPTLEAIFNKYGDITSRCILKSTSVRACLLEIICNVVQRLERNDFEAILSDLEIIENEVSDVEANNIDVSWLDEHLATLRKIAVCREKYSELRKTKAKSGAVTSAAIEDLCLAQERFKEAEKRVNVMRLVDRKIDDDMMEFESEEYFWRRRLDDVL